MLIAAQGHYANPQLWWAILFFAVGQVFSNLTEVFTAVFRAYQQMQYQAFTVIFGQALIVLFTFVAIGLDWGLAGLFGARLVANLLRLVAGWYLSRRRFIREAVSTDWRSMWYLLKESFPLGINMFVRRFIWRGGIVMLTTILNAQAPGQGDLAAGLLYGPIRLVEQMRIVPAALIGAILPVFAQQARLQPQKFRKTLAQSLKLFIAISLLLAVLMTTLAQQITDLVLGRGLAGASAILAVFGWIILFTFSNQFYEAALLAVGRQWVVAIGLGIGFALGAAATWFYLVPMFAAVGVAYGIMLSEGVVFVISTKAGGFFGVQAGTVDRKEDKELKRLAEDTGGRAFFTAEVIELERSFSAIARELRSQYVVAYSPINDKFDSKFRTIDVRLPNHKNLRIRAKKGYTATPPRNVGASQ